LIDQVISANGVIRLAYRVAVASSDGKFINRHFGNTPQFLIFDIEDGSFTFLECRRNIPPCFGQEHDEGRLEQAVSLLADCRKVLASRIGPGAAKKLVDSGIDPWEIIGFIDGVLEKSIYQENKENQFGV